MTRVAYCGSDESVVSKMDEVCAPIRGPPSVKVKKEKLNISFPILDMSVDEVPNDHTFSAVDKSENLDMVCENVEQSSPFQTHGDITFKNTQDSISLYSVSVKLPNTSNEMSVHNFSSEVPYLEANVYLRMDKNNKPLGEYIEARLDMTNLDSLQSGLLRLISEQAQCPVDEIDISNLKILYYERYRAPTLIVNTADVIHVFSRCEGSREKAKLLISRKQEPRGEIGYHLAQKSSNVTINKKSIPILNKTFTDSASKVPYLDANVYINIDKKNKPVGQYVESHLDMTNIDSLKDGLTQLIFEEANVPKDEIDPFKILYYQKYRAPIPIVCTSDVIHVYARYDSEEKTKLAVAWKQASKEKTDKQSHVMQIIPSALYSKNSMNSTAISVRDSAPKCRYLNANVYLRVDIRNKPVGKYIEAKLDMTNLVSLKAGLKKMISKKAKVPMDEINITKIMDCQKYRQSQSICKETDVIHVYAKYHREEHNAELAIAWEHELKGVTDSQNFVKVTDYKPVVSKQIPGEVHEQMCNTSTHRQSVRRQRKVNMKQTMQMSGLLGQVTGKSWQKSEQTQGLSSNETSSFHGKNEYRILPKPTEMFHDGEKSHKQTNITPTLSVSFLTDQQEEVATEDYESERDNVCETKYMDSLPVVSPSWNPVLKLEHSEDTSSMCHETPIVTLASEVIMEQLQSLWVKKLLCDVTLVCEGDVEIKAHRVILACHSAIFLDNNIFDACNGVYNFRDTKPETMTHTLEYLYGKPINIVTDIQALHTLTYQLDIKALMSSTRSLLLKEKKKGQGNFEGEIFHENECDTKLRAAENIEGIKMFQPDLESHKWDGEDRETEKEWGSADDVAMHVGSCDSGSHNDKTPSVDEYDSKDREKRVNQNDVISVCKRIKVRVKTSKSTIGKTRAHRQGYHGFVCDPCNKPFTSKLYLDEHMDEVHSDGPRIFRKSAKRYEVYHSGGERRYRCLTCDRFDRTWLNMIKHNCIMRMCGVCHKRFRKQTLYDRHKCLSYKERPTYLLNVKPALDETLRIKLRFTESRTCSKCEEEFMIKGDMQKHIEDKHGLFMLYCEKIECNETFMTSEPAILEQHLANVHQDPWLQCPMCDFQSTLWMQVIQHMIKVHKQIQCLLCGYSVCEGHICISRILPHLKRKHQITIESRLFQCSKDGCKFTTYLRNTINVHLLSHSEERPFKCDQCHMAFKFEK